MSKLCTIPGCSKKLKSKGMCAAHYERMRVHGDVNRDDRSGPKVIPVKCRVDDCTNIAVHRTVKLCMLHYGRWNRHGSTDSRLPTYGKGVHIHEQGYKMILVDGKYVMEHIHLAEKALGRPLPKGAVVHHMNNNKTDNFTPLNLIICPDQSYHMLLHKRMREMFPVNSFEDLFGANE